MADKTGEKQPGRGAGRRFRPGESGNPRGRPRGARNHVSTLITEIFCEQAEPLARTVVTLALSGDIAAL